MKIIYLVQTSIALDGTYYPIAAFSTREAADARVEALNAVDARRISAFDWHYMVTEVRLEE